MDIQQTFQKSYTFSQFYSSFENSHRVRTVNCWEPENLVVKTNELITDFLKSKKSNFPDFFKSKLKGIKVKDSFSRYCLIYFFSLEKWKEENYEVATLWSLFHEKLPKTFFQKWQELKEDIYLLHKQGYSNDLYLDAYYLTRPQVLGVASKYVGEKTEILNSWIQENKDKLVEMKREARAGNHIAKQYVEKTSKIFKISSIKASAAANKIFEIFLEEQLKKNLEEDEQGQWTARDIEKYDVFEIEDIEGEEVTKASKMVDLELESLRQQKALLTQEVQDGMTEANDYRQAAILLLGITQAIDPQLDKASLELNQLAKESNCEIKPRITDETKKKLMFNKTGNLQGEIFFTRGSKIHGDNFKGAVKEASNVQFKKAEDMVMRSHAYNTQIRRFRDMYAALLDLNPDIFTEKTYVGKEKQEQTLRDLQSGIHFEELILRNQNLTSSNHKNYHENSVANSVKMDGEPEEVLEGSEIDIKENEFKSRHKGSFKKVNNNNPFKEFFGSSEKKKGDDTSVRSFPKSPNTKNPFFDEITPQGSQIGVVYSQDISELEIVDCDIPEDEMNDILLLDNEDDLERQINADIEEENQKEIQANLNNTNPKKSILKQHGTRASFIKKKASIVKPADYSISNNTIPNKQKRRSTKASKIDKLVKERKSNFRRKTKKSISKPKKSIIPKSKKTQNQKDDPTTMEQYYSKEGELLDIKDLSESKDSEEDYDNISDNVDDYDNDPGLQRRPTALLFSTDQNARKSVSIANFLASNRSKSLIDENVKAKTLEIKQKQQIQKEQKEQEKKDDFAKDKSENENIEIDSPFKHKVSLMEDNNDNSGFMPTPPPDMFQDSSVIIPPPPPLDSTPKNEKQKANKPPRKQEQPEKQRNDKLGGVPLARKSTKPTNVKVNEMAESPPPPPPGLF